MHSYRGGTGKSNLTANLGVAIAKAGKRVAIVDCDIQSPGVHVIFQMDEKSIAYSLNDYLFGRCQIEQAAVDVTSVSIGAANPDERRPKLFLVPSSTKTGEIGRVLKEGYDVALLNDGFKRLIEKLELDFLLIDTHPGVNEETLLSIVVSDRVILILRPDSQDFQGIYVTLELAKRLGVAQPWLVLNKIPPGMDRNTLKEKVESSYERQVVGMFPLNYEIVRLASSGVFINRFPEHPFTVEIQHVADLLTEAKVDACHG
ncbi:MAG: MinD/ParA family protein [Pirellulaceae bacterium]|nr:MinD/ParA family protein [Pirellulaceae bacterium]